MFRLQVIEALSWIMTPLRPSSLRSGRAKRRISIPDTGRITVFPNSLLFTNALIKENPGQEYGLYTLVVPLRDQDDWQDAERRLLDAAKTECASFMEEAGRQMKLLEQTNQLEAPSPDRGRSKIEQAILRRFLAEPR